MAKIDLRGKSKAELLKLQRDIDKAIDQRRKKEKAEALAAAEAAAKKHGFKLSDLLEPAKGRKPRKDKGKRRNPLPPKYRHPENSEVTWSGAGRRPGWVVEYTASGKPVEDLLIA